MLVPIKCSKIATCDSLAEFGGTLPVPGTGANRPAMAPKRRAPVTRGQSLRLDVVAPTLLYSSASFLVMAAVDDSRIPIAAAPW